MHKILYIVFFFLLIQFSNAQEALEVDTVIPMPSLSKDVAFIKMSEWASTRFNSANDAIQLSDKEASIIICKGLFPFEYGKSITYGNLWGKISYTLITRFKDGRIRITVNGFSHETNLPNNMISVSLGAVNTGAHPKYGKNRYVKKYWAALQEECVVYSKSLISDITKFITDNADDNW